MARTNKYGYFCDYPCGFMNSKCKNFFCAGCASAGMRLTPNKEYPDVIVVRDQEGSKNEVHGKELL